MSSEFEPEAMAASVRDYLLDRDEISFHDAFFAFARLHRLQTQLTREDAATSTADLSPDPLLPSTVVVVHRKTQVGRFRRQGMRLVLDRFLSTMMCDREETLEELWNTNWDAAPAKNQAGSLWAEKQEGEIYQKANDDLNDYESILLNFVFDLARRNTRKGIPEGHVTNSSAQTTDSELQGRQRTVEQILKARKPPHITEKEFVILVKQNRRSKKKAERRRRLELRHSFSQTGSRSLSVGSGWKSPESESSPAFEWLEFLPRPIRFLPVFSAQTQTNQGEIDQTRPIVCGRDAQVVAAVGTKAVDVTIGFFQDYMENVSVLDDDFEETLMGFACGMDFSDVRTWLRLGALVQALGHRFPGYCHIHKGRVPKRDCLVCQLAVSMPAPWMDSYFRAVCEAYSGKELCRPRAQSLFQQGALGPQFSILVNVLRHLHFVRTRRRQYRRDLSGQLVPTGFASKKAVRKDMLDCACPLPLLKKFFSEEAEDMEDEDYGHKMVSCCRKDLEEGRAHLKLGHECLECGAREKAVGREFLVCSWCRRQRLFVRAHFCSFDCLLKAWHSHRKLHEAFQPGRLPQFRISEIPFP